MIKKRYLNDRDRDVVRRGGAEWNRWGREKPEPEKEWNRWGWETGSGEGVDAVDELGIRSGEVYELAVFGEPWFY